MRTLLVTLALLLVPSLVQAQTTDPCGVTPPAPDVVLAGGRPYVVWAESPTAIVGGFYVQVDAGATAGGFLAKTDVGLPVPYLTCPNGTLAYRYQLATVPVGSYTAKVSTWNLTLAGARQESALVARPFAAQSETASPAPPATVRVSP